MHALPRRHRLDVARAVAHGGRPRAKARDRSSARRRRPGGGPHHLRFGRRRRLADPGPDPAFPRRDRAPHRRLCRQSAPRSGRGGGGVSAMTTYMILGITFIIAAALAAIPVAMILGRLGFSENWAGLLFLLLLGAPFIPGLVYQILPASFVTALPVAGLGGVLKLIEWTPALIFLWVFALRKSPKGAA